MALDDPTKWTMLPHAMCLAYKDIQSRAQQRCQPPPAFTTGLGPLDVALGPSRAGDLILVAGADPGLRLSFLLRCALGRSEHALLALVCLEHSTSRASHMMIAADAGVPLALLDRGQLDRDRHWPAVADAIERHQERRLAMLEHSAVPPSELPTAILDLKRQYGEITLLVLDALEPLHASDGGSLAGLLRVAREQGFPVLAGVTPLTARALRMTGQSTAVVHLPDLGDEALSTLGPCALPVRVVADRAGGGTTLQLDYDPHCCAWSIPQPPPAGTGGPDSTVEPRPLSRREGKALDAVYSAACCALLHEVGLAHFWDGQPHGPGRAWDLPQHQGISDEQRLMVRIALDIWDNQGGVLLRDLRRLPAHLVASVGELIADTSSWRGPESWVERHLGEGWERWMAEGRWHELLGAGWRGLMGRPPEEPEP
jgi:hypothetical protein